MSPYPPVRVITTSHTPTGRSTIHSDALLPAHHPFGPTASGFTTIHSIPSLPASLITPPTSSPPSIPRPLPNGTVLCTTDFPPNYITPTHRTVTCDYMVVLKGELVLRVDGGEERVLKEGDVVVQRGTMHTWENRTGEWTSELFYYFPAFGFEMGIWEEYGLTVCNRMSSIYGWGSEDCFGGWTAVGGELHAAGEEEWLGWNDLAGC
ncbi:cupin 2 domain-containing protein [Rutstroemia sp. NJR-2017a BVV2]|nr:cupin 2 domain-containing protein [Rutstroemia sp. NJR-2017a BVV2]